MQADTQSIKSLLESRIQCFIDYVKLFEAGVVIVLCGSEKSRAEKAEGTHLDSCSLIHLLQVLTEVVHAVVTRDDNGVGGIAANEAG